MLPGGRELMKWWLYLCSYFTCNNGYIYTECTCCICLEEREWERRAISQILCPVFSWENVCDWKMSRQLQMTIFYTEPKGKSTRRDEENMFFPRSLEGTLGIKWNYKQLRHFLQLHFYHVHLYFMYLKQTLIEA